MYQTILKQTVMLTLASLFHTDGNQAAVCGHHFDNPLLFLRLNVRRTWQQLPWANGNRCLAVKLPQTSQKQPKPAALCGTKTIARKCNKDIINEKNRHSSLTLSSKFGFCIEAPKNSTQILGAPRRPGCCSCGTPSFRSAASFGPRRGHRLGEVDLVTLRWTSRARIRSSEEQGSTATLSTRSDLNNDGAAQ